MSQDVAWSQAGHNAGGPVAIAPKVDHGEPASLQYRGPLPVLVQHYHP